MPTFFRKATSTDQPHIRALIRAGRINPLGVHWQNFIVAVDGAGQIVGCAQLKPHRGGVVELASIVVSEQMQGQGIARQLIKQLQTDYQRKAPSTPLWLMCESGLEPFYNRFGFVAVRISAQMPSYFARINTVANLFAKSPRLTIMRWLP